MTKQFDRLVSLADRLDLKDCPKEAHLIDTFLYRIAITRGAVEGYTIKKICEELKRLHKSSIISKVSGKKKLELVADRYLQVLRDTEQLYSLMKGNIEAGVTDEMYGLVTETMGYFFTALGLYRQNFIDAKRMVVVMNESIKAIKQSFSSLRVDPASPNQEEAIDKLERVDDTVNNLLNELEATLDQGSVNIGGLETVAESVSKQLKTFMSEEGKGDLSLKGLFEDGTFTIKQQPIRSFRTLLDHAKQNQNLKTYAYMYEEQLALQKKLRSIHTQVYADALLKFEELKRKVNEADSRELEDEQREELEDFISLMSMYIINPEEETKEENAEEGFGVLNEFDEKEATLIAQVKLGAIFAPSPDLTEDTTPTGKLKTQVKQRIDKLQDITQQRKLVERRIEKYRDIILKEAETLQKDRVKSAWNEFTNTINQHLQRIKICTKELSNIDKRVKEFGEKVDVFEKGILPVFGLENK